MRLLVRFSFGLLGTFAIYAEVPCNKGHFEIGFVNADTTTSAFSDERYARELSANISICSDSRLTYRKSSKPVPSDQLVLRDLNGNPLQPYRCGQNLNCSNPDDLRAQLHQQLSAKLKGKSLWESWQILLRAGSGQTSTAARSTFGRNADSIRRLLIIRHGANIDGDTLNQASTKGLEVKVDLCQNADRRECGEILPTPRSLPLAPPPSGIHLLWELMYLPGDKEPLRDPNTLHCLIVADPSWQQSSLEEARTAWAVFLTALPAYETDRFPEALLALGKILSAPPHATPSSR